MILNTKLSYSNFIKISIYAFIIFVSYHLITWTLYTSKIFGLPGNHHVGDLGRMSYQVDLLNERKLEYTLSKRHLNINNYINQKIDLITIGDSFSNGAANGLNPYYQDYLATKYNINVLNIKRIEKQNFINTIIGLYNNGILEKLRPKVILIETVERQLVRLYQEKNDLAYHPKIKTLNQVLSSNVMHNTLPELQLINSINYKIPFYMIQNSLKENKAHNAYKFSLKQEMFTSRTTNKLLVYKDDVKNMSSFTKGNILDINDKFNQLALLLKPLNIKLFFMPAVDKYDLYYDYIINNEYQKNTFFDLLRQMYKEYYFVDTKQILLPLLKNGVKDVFYPDDTHWSYKASEAVVNADIFKKSL